MGKVLQFRRRKKPPTTGSSFPCADCGKMGRNIVYPLPEGYKPHPAMGVSTIMCEKCYDKLLKLDDEPTGMTCGELRSLTKAQ